MGRVRIVSCPTYDWDRRAFCEPEQKGKSQRKAANLHRSSGRAMVTGAVKFKHGTCIPVVGMTAALLVQVIASDEVEE